MRLRAARTALVAVALAMYPAVIIGAPSLDQPPRDDQIQARIERLLASAKLDAVAVKVHEGAVTLEGTVRNTWERRRAYETVRKVGGIRSVLSNLAVHRSASDQVIATEVERRIRDFPFYTIFDSVAVDVGNGRV